MYHKSSSPDGMRTGTSPVQKLKRRFPSAFHSILACDRAIDTCLLEFWEFAGRKTLMPANNDSTATVGTKWAIKNATGGDTLALAIAMLETSDLRSNYPFGDVTADKPPVPKTGDAANFGIYKMNWYMIQQLSSATNG